MIDIRERVLYDNFHKSQIGAVYYDPNPDGEPATIDEVKQQHKISHIYGQELHFPRCDVRFCEYCGRRLIITSQR